MIPDLPAPPPPPLHPGTGQPIGPEDLAPLFPMELIRQEVATDPYIAIPEDVLDVYRLWRPTPLYRARRLEKDLGTPARIYYKYEGGSPAGSHKPNTAVPQAYYNAAEGVRKLTTETGAGQWGSALAFASSLFGIDLEVWMVRASYDQKPYRKMLMETYGATVHPSPSDVTSAGRAVLAEHPDSTGSLGIAISEAVEVAGGDPAGFTPLLKMHTLGHEFIPDPIHAGGLRYHGMSPLMSHIYEIGLIEAVAKRQSECFEAGLRFARTEGIVPAPEPTHAVAACIEEALRCKETGEEKVILTALCGHGLLDLAAYADYMAGQLRDYELAEQAIDDALKGLPVGV